jgi:hypothetical protein
MIAVSFMNLRENVVIDKEKFYDFTQFTTLQTTTAHAHHVTRHNTPIHNILSTTPQLSISQKALGTLPDGNVMQKHVGVTIHN